jgi:GTP-binding protein Era
MKAGFIGVIGQPNAGKSSLVNALVKEKVSIVTDKPQTTRRRILGILSEPETQFVFVDAPGILNEKKATKGLNGFLALEARDVMTSSDVLLGVLSVDEEKPEHLEEVLTFLKEGKKDVVLVLHKTDMTELYLRRKDKINDMIKKHFPDAPIFELSSANTKDELQIEKQKELLKVLSAMLPESPAPLFEVDLFTPQSTRDLVAEIVREKCFQVLHQEVPYNLAVQVAKFDEADPGMLRIWVDIWIGRESHKAIVIGKAGANLKEIGTLARKEAEAILQTKIFLSLNVVVKEDWFLNTRKMKDLGYVVESE